MKRLIIALIGSVQMLFLTACTSGAFFIANLPQYFSDVKIVRDVAYGDSAHHKLDIYQPKLKAGATAPVIVFLYGGRWQDGHKEQYRFVGLNLAQKGYIVVMPDYAKYPAVKFPVFVEDVARALAWTHDHIEDYGGQVENLYLSGHSSGAHIGGLVASNPEYLRTHDKSRDIISAFAGLSGPYAFVPEAEDLKDMFGPPEKYPLMRTSNFIDGDQPPMFLMHGAEDELVVFKNARKVKQAAEKNGGTVRLKLYEDIDHIDTVATFSWVKSDISSIPEDMVSFFKEYSK